MSNVSSHLIDNKLFLVRQTITSLKKVKLAPAVVNHLVVLDCSGSMTGELPQIREQLKNKLPKMMREHDTISIVWFSGKGEFGTLIEAEPVPTLKDLKQVQTAIDRWLKPIGLTGFKEPLEEVSKLIDRVAKKVKDSVFSLFFLSDGCDNQWPRPSILAAVEKAAGKLAASTFVEYGYYADRALLASMAEKAGGQHIFAEDFSSYVPKFEKVLATLITGSGKRIEVTIEGDPILGLAWTMTPDGDLLTFEVTGDKILVPEGTTEIAYLAPKSVGTKADSLGDAAVEAWKKKITPPGLAEAYAALSLLAVRMKPEIVFPILKALGDVNFIQNFGKCFGKQKYSEFMDNTKLAAFQADHRFVSGWDPTAVPDDNAFTVLDLLKALTEDDNVRVMLDHSSFQYSRISRGRVDADDSPNALKFVADPSPEGYPISSLTYNEDRPNISLLVRKNGTVDLSGIKPAALKKVPNVIDTFIFRNYAIVKDGLVNISRLPLQLPAGVKAVLKKNGVVMIDDGDVTIVEVSPLPIINRAMVQATSAKTLLELEYELTKQRAYQKVWNGLRKELAPKVSTGGYAKVYGEEAATWLKEQGLTDYSGFGPKQVSVESKDFYLGKEMAVSLKGYSSLPSVNEVKTKIASKKAVTGGAVFMVEAIDEAERFLKSNPEKLHEKWVGAKADVATTVTRGLIHRAATIKMAVIVSQTWFTEWKTLDENIMTIRQDGKDIEGAIKLNEVEIRI